MKRNHRYWLSTLVCLVLLMGLFTPGFAQPIDGGDFTEEFEVLPTEGWEFTPDITVERDYEKGEFDLNIAPLVVQYYLGPKLALKAASIVNLHVHEGSEISHLGGQLSLPVYFLAHKESFASGIYLAPVFGLTHNLGGAPFRNVAAVAVIGGDGDQVTAGRNGVDGAGIDDDRAGNIAGADIGGGRARIGRVHQTVLDGELGVLEAGHRVEALDAAEQQQDTAGLAERTADLAECQVGERRDLLAAARGRARGR